MAGQSDKANRFIEGFCPFVLGIDDQREGTNSQSVRPHDSVGDQCASQALALMLERDREAPDQHGGHDRISWQAFGHPLGQGIKRHARGGKRIEARDPSVLVGGDKTTGHATPDILGGPLLEIAIKRIRTAAKRAAVVSLAERLGNEWRDHRTSPIKRR